MTVLTLGTKLAAVRILLSGGRISPLAGRISLDDVCRLQRFLWNVSIELSLALTGDAPGRRYLTRHMEPTSLYMARKRCPAKTYECKAAHCLRVSPECAREKLLGQLDALARAAGSWFARCPTRVGKG
ncbi:MAG: hypothetical protein ONB23_08270 [candidate division KSB1 bacterium]|nr:hypothetical protein [candidate division KSB1 bacterium]